MPTTAPLGLLDRDLSRAEARAAIDIAVPLLTEIVNQGLAVLARCFAPPIQGDVHMAVLLPFHHLLEMLDGVQVLVGEAAPSAARPQLRSMLEALLYIEHVTATGPDTLAYAIRGYAYLVARTRSALKALRALRRYDAATPEGRELIARNVVKINRSMQDIDSNIANLEARLVKAPWCDVDSSRQALHRSRRPWFCLGTGTPSNLEELADRFGRSYYYDVLYRDYSGSVHAARGRFMRRTPHGRSSRTLPGRSKFAGSVIPMSCTTSSASRLISRSAPSSGCCSRIARRSSERTSCGTCARCRLRTSSSIRDRCVSAGQVEEKA